MKQSKNTLKALQLCFTADKWRVYDTKKDNDTNSSLSLNKNNGKQLKFLALNVLFDERNNEKQKPHIIHSTIRFSHQFKLFEESKADVICLNECTMNYINLLKKEEFVKKGYFLIYTGRRDGYGMKFGNVVLSKFPFDEIFECSIGKLKRGGPLICVKDDLKFVISSAHLTAYKEKFKIRKEELNELYKLMDDKWPDYGNIILGDLNFHSEKENSNIRDDYLDIWSKFYEKTPEKITNGYTFDCAKNLMNYQIWPAGSYFGFDSKGLQMRLDRQLLKFPKEKKIKIVDIKIIGNTPCFPEEAKEIKSNFFYDITAAIGDFFEKNFWRNYKEYLFLSDHFGLETILEFE